MQRISPLPIAKRDKIPVGVIYATGKIDAEQGARILYCDSAKPAIRYAKTYGGTATISRTRGSTRWIRIESNGLTIYPGTYCTDIGELTRFRDFCHSIGIDAGGIPSMGMRLMRYTLPGYFDISQGEEIPWTKFPPGARMHARPGIYYNVHQADITAAYLWSLGQQSPVRTYEYLGSSKAGRWGAMKDYPGSWALIRYRYRKSPNFGIIAQVREDGTTGYPNYEGSWHGPTLVSSYDLENLYHDCDIEIRKAWIATDTVTQPFRAFMHLIMELRQEFPLAAKQAGNSLWGSFGASTDLALVEYEPGKNSHKVRRLPPRPAISIPVAALTLSRLRAEMASVARRHSTVHVHTDGFMTTSLTSFPREKSSGPGEWRLANKFREVEILNPSWYRTINEEGLETFKLAGRPEVSGKTARSIFHHNRDREGRIFR